MSIKTYRSFIRESKKTINSITVSSSNDILFENNFYSCLVGDITIQQFKDYLAEEFEITLNESKIGDMIDKAKELYINISEKIKSIFNNLWDKIKESKGVEIIISFFNSVSSYLSKVWSYLKNTKFGKNIRKMLITLGIATSVGYILSKYKTKISESNKNHLLKFDQFSKNLNLVNELLTLSTGYKSSGLKKPEEDKYTVLNRFLNKIEALDKNKQKFPVLIDFYKKVLKRQSSIDTINQNIRNIKKSIRDENKNEDLIKESLKNIVSILRDLPNQVTLKEISINSDQDFYNIINIEELDKYLKTDIGKKTGDIHKSLLNVLKAFGIIEIKIDNKPKRKKGTLSVDDEENDETTTNSIKPIDNKTDDEKLPNSITSKYKDLKIEELFKSFWRWSKVILFATILILISIGININIKNKPNNIQTNNFEKFLEEDFEKSVESLEPLVVDLNDNTKDIKKSQKIDLSSENGKKVNELIQDTLKEVGSEIGENKEEISESVAKEINQISKKVFEYWVDVDMESITDEIFEILPNEKIVISKDDYKAESTLRVKTGVLIMRTIINQKHGSDYKNEKDYTLKTSGSVSADVVRNLYDKKIFKDEKGNYHAVYLKKDKIGGSVSQERWDEFEKNIK